MSQFLEGTINFAVRLYLREAPSTSAATVDVLYGAYEGSVDSTFSDDKYNYHWRHIRIHNDTVTGYVAEYSLTNESIKFFTFAPKEASEVDRESALPTDRDTTTVNWALTHKTIAPIDDIAEIYKFTTQSQPSIQSIKLPQNVYLSEEAFDVNANGILWYRIQTLDTIGYVRQDTIYVYDAFSDIRQMLYYVDFGAFTITASDTERQLMILDYTHRAELIDRILTALQNARLTNES